jgi:hypothetical protein
MMLLAVALLSFVTCASPATAQTDTVQQAATLDHPTTATALLDSCMNSLPREHLELTGAITVRRQRGIILQEQPYRLALDWGAMPPRVRCDLLDDKGNTAQRFTITRRSDRAEIELHSGPTLTTQKAPALSDKIANTDLTWTDLTLDFLWWHNARLDGADTIKGRACDVVVVTPPNPTADNSGMRLWIDREARFLMQAEQLDSTGKSTRRMWVRSVKKFNNRWLIQELEIETFGSNVRSRLRVDDVLTENGTSLPAATAPSVTSDPTTP